jgi:hypothetical protein
VERHYIRIRLAPNTWLGWTIALLIIAGIAIAAFFFRVALVAVVVLILIAVVVLILLSLVRTLFSSRRREGKIIEGIHQAEPEEPKSARPTRRITRKA